MRPEVAGLAAELAGLSGAVAVVLGGSRATGTHRPDSDWDLGLYYRSSERRLDPNEVRALGHDGYVSELGEWGPFMHGGAWLTIDGTPIDVLFRDLDAVEHWQREAEEGRYEVLTQNGYIVGAPTYLLVGELAISRPISGDVPSAGFPDALAETAPARWSGRARVSLMFARGYAGLADSVCCAAMLADAALCIAHARLAERREWALNEKRLIERAGLGDAQPLLAAPGGTTGELERTVGDMAAVLEIEPLTAR